MLLQDNAKVPLGLTAQILLSIALLVLPLLLPLRGTHELWQAVALAVLLVALTTLLMLRLADLWFPPGSALGVLGLAALVLLVRQLRRTHHQAQSDPLPAGHPRRFERTEPDLL